MGIQDIFTYQLNINIKKNIITKRVILSVIAQLWHPLGLISPVVVNAKLILQKLCTLKLTWDDIVPEELSNRWIQFISDLSHVNNIKISRKILISPAINVEMHGFCDNSQVAYGAAVFIRSQDSSGNYSTNLLCSKSRLAHFKTISIPRLELCGGVLLVRLMTKVLPVLNLNITKRFYWTDSSIVLAWIAAPPNTWNTFVANRVAKIPSSSKFEE